MSEHVVSPKIYTAILGALLFFTLLTVGAALKDFGPWNIVFALAIATIKATLVILFFMHARYIKGRTQLVIVAGFFWLAILLSLTLIDYHTRPKHEPGDSQRYLPAAHIHRV